MDIKVERLPAMWAEGLLSLFHIGTGQIPIYIYIYIHVTALSSNPIPNLSLS